MEAASPAQLEVEEAVEEAAAAQGLLAVQLAPAWGRDEVARLGEVEVESEFGVVPSAQRPP